MIDACARSGNNVHTFEVFSRTRRGPEHIGVPSLRVGERLEDLLSRCGGEMDSALSVFSNILEPNVLSWTAAIGGSAQSGMVEEGHELVQEDGGSRRGGGRVLAC